MAPFRVMGSFPDTTAFETISGDDRALSYFKLKWTETDARGPLWPLLTEESLRCHQGSYGVKRSAWHAAMTA